MGEPAVAADAVLRLQQRWGTSIIRRGVAAVSPHGATALHTGFAALDALLGSRGLPHGLTHLRGALGSGRTTLALRALATAQAAGCAAAWIDGSRTFDPLEAATRGVSLAALPIVVPLHLSEAIDMAGAILSADAADLLVFDLSDLRGAQRHRIELERLAARARRAGAALILIADDATCTAADLTLCCSTTHLLRIGNDIVGRALHVELGSGPRARSSVVLQIFEGRGAREDLRAAHLAPEEVPCERSTFTGRH